MSIHNYESDFFFMNKIKNFKFMEIKGRNVSGCQYEITEVIKVT